MKFAFYNGSDGIYRLVTNSNTRSGGATKQQLLLAQTLQKQGHEIIFITPADKPKTSIVEVSGLRFIFSPLRTTNFTFRKILKREKPTWLYWRSNSLHLGPCFFLAKSFDISVVYACASDKDCTPRFALNPFSFHRHFWPLYQWGLDQADKIIIQHPGQKTLFGDKYCPKIRQVNNIALVPEINIDKTNSPYIAWVGNLRYEKRPDRLVEIAKRLPQSKFIVCGAALNYRSQPGYIESIRSSLSELPNVDYKGSVSTQETLKVIGNASLFLSTSEQEGFPNTMLEAWSLGVPVISLNLDLGGIITNQKIGLVTKDIADTSASIIKLMKFSELRKQMGKNGVRYVQEEHSPSMVYQQLKEALDIEK